MTVERDIYAQLAAAVRIYGERVRLEGYPEPSWCKGVFETLRLLASDTEGQGVPTVVSLATHPHYVDVLAYTYKETAELLRVSVRTIKRLVAGGELPVVDVANEPRIAHNDVVAFMAANRKTRRSFRDNVDTKLAPVSRPSTTLRAAAPAVALRRPLNAAGDSERSRSGAGVSPHSPLPRPPRGAA